MRNASTLHGMPRSELILRSYRIPKSLDRAMQKYSLASDRSLSDIVRVSVAKHLGVSVTGGHQRRKRRP